MARASLRITSRFAVVLVVLVPTILALAGFGLAGLQSGRNSATVLYRDHLLTSQRVNALQGALAGVEQGELRLLLTDRADRRSTLMTDLLVRRAPAVDTALNAVSAQASDDPAERNDVATVTAAWARFRTLQATNALSATAPAAVAGTARQMTDIFDVATAAADSISRIETSQADAAYRKARDAYRANVRSMVVVEIFGLLFAVAVVIWLIRSVLPRTLAYSAFAADLSRGDYSRRLAPTGGDELADLGRVLDDLADRRERGDKYDHAQQELIDALQLTESEEETHGLLKRHLERSLAATEVTILNRNNSADRLEAMTPVEPGSALAAGLESARPRSCLGVRKARIHTSTGEQDPLLGCPVCSSCPGLTTCTPLVVGGEVIGSVLANHADPLTDTEARAIREAVSQGAPVMGNLRNLAIAELRAATDALTGLPNRRAVEDTIRRTVAQATRTMSPLSALMCDLDHFKQINDRYGHGRGDDVLAAVGTILSSTIRVSDFAGRYGGEEFIVLLPDTDAASAKVIADKIRAAVAAITVPTVEQAITMSVGIAAIPEHALDGESLQRAADRALYTAKSNGRDRTELFENQAQRSVQRTFDEDGASRPGAVPR